MTGYRKPLALLLVIQLHLLGCSNQGTDPAAKVDLGSVENSVYTNEFFGFKLTLPEDWKIQDQQSNEQLMKLGTGVLSGDNAEVKAAAEASAQSTYNLVTVFRYELGSPVPFNPSLICTAENLKMVPGVKKGSDLLFHTRKILEASPMNVEFAEPDAGATNGSGKLDELHATMNLMGIAVQQEYYATVVNGYGLAFIISYTSEDEREVLRSVIDSISFD